MSSEAANARPEAKDAVGNILSDGDSVALIPERNWNLKKPEEKALKIAKLDELVRESSARGMPLIIGTGAHSGAHRFRAIGYRRRSRSDDRRPEGCRRPPDGRRR